MDWLSANWYLVLAAASVLIWGIRLEGRVNALKAKLKSDKEMRETIDEQHGKDINGVGKKVERHSLILVEHGQKLTEAGHPPRVFE